MAIRFPSMAVTKIAAFVKAFESYGISPHEAFTRAGVAPSLLRVPDNRLTAAEVDQIFHMAVRISHDEDIGLRQGESLAKGFANVLGYLLLNCRTLGEAAAKYCRYESILDQTSHTEIQMDGERARMVITVCPGPLSGNRCLIDYKMAGILAYVKLLTGQRLPLREAHFTYARPGKTLLFQQVFNCPVCFEKTANILIMDSASLNLPVMEPNPSLLPFFEDKTREIWEQSVPGISFSQEVRRHIYELMSVGRGRELCTVAQVAAKMALSVRSLQLYLKKEQTCFSQLLDEIRRELALDYLQRENVTLDEVAWLLGFSELSSFHRTFKKWMNLTPGQFRKKVFGNGPNL